MLQKRKEFLAVAAGIPLILGAKELFLKQNHVNAAELPRAAAVAFAPAGFENHLRATQNLLSFQQIFLV